MRICDDCIHADICINTTQGNCSDYLSEKLIRPQGEFNRKDLESWLYQIAMNNIGTEFEKSVVEIIKRLDGFERFVSEQKGGVENDH